MVVVAALVTSASAQDGNIRSVTLYTVKPDRVGDFQAEIKEYNAVLAKGGSTHYNSVWLSLTGPREYALVSYRNKWADLDGLGPVPFLFDEPALPRPVGHRLVLKGALTALVADGAVQGVVEEQELEHALLGLTGRLGLGEDLLAIGNLDITSRLQARASRTGDLDKAHAAHPNRLHPRVVAKARDENPGPLGGRDDELALLRFHSPPVDGDGDARWGFDDVSHGAPCPGGTGTSPL